MSNLLQKQVELFIESIMKNRQILYGKLLLKVEK